MKIVDSFLAAALAALVTTLAGCSVSATTPDRAGALQSALGAEKASPSSDTSPEPAPAPPAELAEKATDKDGAGGGLTSAQNGCLAELKAKLLAEGDYEAASQAFAKLAVSVCGVDFASGGSGDSGGGGAPAPSAPDPSPSYVACANAVKAEVSAGTLPIEKYEAEIDARCAVPTAKSVK